MCAESGGHSCHEVWLNEKCVRIYPLKALMRLFLYIINGQITMSGQTLIY